MIITVYTDLLLEYTHLLPVSCSAALLPSVSAVTSHTCVCAGGLLTLTAKSPITGTWQPLPGYICYHLN